MAAIELALLVALALSGTATLVYWSVVLFHVVRTMVVIPTARRGLGLPITAPGEDAPRVCVVIPAHNEEDCIADVARSLAAQDYPALSCVFVLDRCTDRTRAVLEEAWGSSAQLPRHTLEIIELDSCPPGWIGKSHAVWVGATTPASARAADLFLFVDADTLLHPDLLRSTVALMRERKVGMLSLLSTLTHRNWYEQLVQPAATMELMRQYPIVRANTPPSKRRRAFANGQFILMRRKEYFEIGGHEALREWLLEDVELARRCAAANIPSALLLADGLLHCRMYESYGAFRNGWKRILGESVNRKPARLRKTAARVRWICTVLPFLSAVAVAAGLLRLHGPHHAAAWVSAGLGAGGVAVYLLVLALTYKLGRSPIWAAPGFAIGSWLVAGIMRDAARDLEERKPTAWGGREYTREAR